MRHVKSRKLRAALLFAAAFMTLAIMAAAIVVRSRRTQTDVAHQVAPAVWQVRNFLSDVYGARVGERAVLFDAGLDRDGHALDELLRGMGAGRADVSDIFLTHAHADHAAGAGLFPNARVHIGARDAGMLAQREAARPLVPRLFGVLLAAPGVLATNELDGRTAVSIGSGQSVLALPFPGHTPGSFLYLFEGVLFTGDSILMDRGSLSRANPNHSVDPAENVRSIARLTTLLDGTRVDLVCTGHMGCTDGRHATQLIDALTGGAR